MKLLLDQNLSPRLVRRLADLYPNSRHVMEVGLDRSLDKEVWNYARQHEYLIVTKDVDFSELSLILGFPPKVIWIRRGNCSTHDIETILREKFNSINAMNEDEGIGIIELF
jgi:predicted nuclease of predicted toxin-antitoxin system